MKNMLQMLMASSVFLLAANKVHAVPREIAHHHEPTYLTVFNHWHHPIHVEEGLLMKKASDVHSGGSVNWYMYNDSVSNLKISYYKDGKWETVPTCPSGSFDGGMRVAVAPANWDPNVPVCYIL